MRLFDANIQENLCNPTSAAHDAANQLLSLLQIPK
jgi:hypothetical protein